MITIKDIEAAEALLGIAYTLGERAQMVGNLDGQIASAVVRRGVTLSNDMPMVRPGPHRPRLRLWSNRSRSSGG